MTYTDLLSNLWCAPYDIEGCLHPTVRPGPCKGGGTAKRLLNPAKKRLTEPKPKRKPKQPAPGKAPKPAPPTQHEVPTDTAPTDATPEGPSNLTKTDFAPSGTSDDQMIDQAARNSAARWKVTPADLEALAREDGLWNHIQNLPFDEQREQFAGSVIKRWTGSSGGPIATAAITGVLDKLGAGYKLDNPEEATQAWMAEHPEMRRAAESLGQAIYDETQAWLKERGITSVHAYRGSYDAAWDNTRPYTSWSAVKGWARSDSDRVIREADIPAERIFSVPPTGFGSLGELELVVLPISATSRQASAAPSGAHDACTVELCLHPLHPGPCEGWRGLPTTGDHPRKATRRIARPAKRSRRVKGRDITDEVDFEDLKNTTPPGKVFAGDPDRRLLKLGALQGFDGQPDLGSPAELDELIQQGGHELFRGTKSSRGRTGAAFAEDFRTGPLYYGPGMYGSGVYTTTSRREADVYAGQEDPAAINRMVLHPDAKVIDFADLQREVAAAQPRTYKRKEEEQQEEDFLSMLGLLPPPAERERDAELEAHFQRRYDADARELLTDTSNYAVSQGYDAVRVPGVGIDGNDNWVLLNRTAVTAERPTPARTASAHTECTVEACLHPLHPGPCRGWHGAPATKVRPGRHRAKEPEKFTPKPPTKGRDLTEELDYDALTVKTRRNDVGADELLAAIAAKQGFDGPPQLASAEDLDQLAADGAVELWRGLKDFGNWRTGTVTTGAELAEQFRTGPVHYGQGVYGNGIYTANDKSLATVFAGDAAANGGVIRMVINPEANLISLDEAKARSAEHATSEARTLRNAAADKLFNTVSPDSPEDVKQAAYDEYHRTLRAMDTKERVLTDPASWAMAAGYDGYYQPVVYLGPGGREYIMFNRTALVAEDPKRSQTASAFSPPECTVELCRNPLHPGPCKGNRKGHGIVPKLAPHRAPKAPKAHSKRVPGKDLTSKLDYTDLNAKRTETFSEDRRLAGIAAAQGFDGKPERVSPEDFDQLVADGAPVLYRGVHSAKGRTGAELAQEFRDGDAFYGTGIHGNGIYASPNEKTALFYAERKPKGVVRMTLQPDAKTITLTEARDRSKAHREGQADYYAGQKKLFDSMSTAPAESDKQEVFNQFLRDSAAYEADPTHHRNLVLADASAWAAANGYDAITLRGEARRGGKDEDQVIILNRTALIVDDPQLGAPAARRGPAKAARTVSAAHDPDPVFGCDGIEACKNPVHKGPCKKTKPKVKCTGKGKRRKCVRILPPKPKPQPVTKVAPKTGPVRQVQRRVAVHPRYTGPGVGNTPQVVLPKGKGKNLIRAAAGDGAFAELFDGSIGACLHPRVHPGPCAGPRAVRRKLTRRRARPQGRDRRGELDYSALQQKIYDAGPQDEALAEIARQQGFDALPETGDSALLDSLKADGGLELFRGLKASGGVSGAEYADRFRTGDAFYGRGAYGNGIYAGYSDGVAGLYSGGEPGAVVRMVLHPDARIADGTELDREMRAATAAATAEQARLTARLGELNRDPQVSEQTRQQAVADYWDWKRAQGARDTVLGDKGRYAAAQGYDAIRQPSFGSAGDNEIVILLNRGAVTVEGPSRASQARAAAASQLPPTDPPMGDLSTLGTIVAGCIHNPNVHACLHPVVHPGPCKGWKGNVAKAVRPARPRKAAKPRSPAATRTPATPKAPAAKSANARTKGSGPGTGKPGLYQALPYEQIAKLPTDNNRSDDQLAAIAKQQGFNVVPQLADDTELNQAVAAGGTRLWRGMQGFSGTTGDQFADQFRTGNAFYGQNPRGNGIITKDSQADALSVASSPGAVVEMVLPANAKVISRDDLAKQADTRSKQWARRQTYLLNGVQKSANPADRQKALDLYQRWQDGATGRDSVVADPGRLAAALGFDAIADKDSAGRLTNVTVLNRGALLVKDPARTGPSAPVAPSMPTTPAAPPPPSAPTAPTSPASPSANPTPVAAPKIKRKAGKNLTAKLDYDAIGPLTTNDGTGYDEKLAAIAKAQGFDGKPTLVTKAEADALIAAGGKEVWRGLSGFTNYQVTPPKRYTAKELTEQFRKDPSAHYGQGIYGNGIYMSNRQATAASTYADGTPGSLMRIVIPPDAKIIDHATASRNAVAEARKRSAALAAAYAKIRTAGSPAAASQAYDDYTALQNSGNSRDAVLGDPSRWAAANGYDATRVSISGREDYYVLLNRTAVAVEKG